MTDRSLSSLLRFLRRETAAESDLVPDGELLARYVATRDEAAFELLVRRHGPLVLGTAILATQQANTSKLTAED